MSVRDVLLIRGPEEGVNLVRALAGAPPLPAAPEDDTPALSELDRAVDILVELKDLAEAAVGLAYSSLLFNNRSLAAEVGALEARSDDLHDELESWVLRAAPEARNPDELRGLLRLASAGESVCDAARDMTWYVEHGEPLHPVVQMALEETEETSAETVVQPGSPAAGRTLQGAARWRPRPGCSSSPCSAVPAGSTGRAGRSSSCEGDRLISVGPEEGEEELWALTGMPVAVDG